MNHGGTEMGQGLHTKILGVAMRELGLPASSIRVMPTSTDKVPNTSATAASSGADLNGAAVKAACVTLRERLAPHGRRAPFQESRRLGFRGGGRFQRRVCASRPAEGCRARVPFAEVCEKAYRQRVSLSATGYYATPGITWDWEKQEGRPFYYFACGAAVSEVEVDGYTGMHRVLRVDIVHDVGESLNPGVDRGQIEGGFVQGIGWLTREELAWDKEGRLLTHSASTYQIPAISDAPLEMHVTLLPKPPSRARSTGARQLASLLSCWPSPCGKPSATLSPLSGQPGGEVPLAAPSTSEAIFTAIQARRNGGKARD